MLGLWFIRLTRVGRGTALATVLIIDDDPLIRELVDVLLTQLDYTVASAASADLAEGQHAERGDHAEQDD